MSETEAKPQITKREILGTLAFFGFASSLLALAFWLYSDRGPGDLADMKRFLAIGVVMLGGPMWLAILYGIFVAVTNIWRKEL